MSAKKRKKSSFGRNICALGLLIKVIQLISTSLGVSEMGNTVWTAIFVCLTAGGLFIVALEWRGATSIFSAACALGVMLSLISTQNTVILNCILYFWLISYALMLFSIPMTFFTRRTAARCRPARRRWRSISGIFHCKSRVFPDPAPPAD